MQQTTVMNMNSRVDHESVPLPSLTLGLADDLFKKLVTSAPPSSPAWAVRLCRAARSYLGLWHVRTRHFA